MQSKRYLFDRIGTISDILEADKAEVEFQYDCGIGKAILEKDKYFHKGKRIPDDKHLNQYITVGQEVIFSCHLLNNQEDKTVVWYIMNCQKNETDPERMNLKAGLVNIPGKIHALYNKHGVIVTEYLSDHESIYFLASKLYFNEKKLSSSTFLNEVLEMDDIVYFDAVPSYPEENDAYCAWFATLVYKGKRPKTHQLTDNKQNTDDKDRKTFPSGNKVTDKNSQATKSYIHDVIGCYTNDARNMFALGRGMIMDILNEEFGIVLGHFTRNYFQSILFHRKSVFLSKMCLASNNLTEIFEEGDRVKFIAVGAPSDFPADWIAIQISILDNEEFFSNNRKDDFSF